MQKEQSKPIRLTIKKLGINGEGIGYFKKTIVFVPGALPKEEVLVKITKKRPNFIEGKLIKVLKPSPNRIEPACPHYNDCGGCQLQHLNYKAQCDFKVDVIRQSLQKFKPEGYQTYQLRPTIGMDTPWHYRNKLQFQVRSQHNHLALGLYKENSHQLIDLTDCLVQDELTQSLLNRIRNLISLHHLQPYNERKHQGWLRTIMIRVGQKTGEAQLVLITTKERFPQKNAFIRDIRQNCPEIVSIIQNINNAKTSLIMGDRELVLWGKEAIDEKLDELTFHLSARAFFQLNPAQTEVLYAEARKAIEACQDDIIIDAYCGVGTIGLSLASHVKAIYGMDIIPAAIDDAKKNAQQMNLTNTHYEVGKAEDWIPQWLNKGIKPTGIIVDPPRTGLDETLLKTLIKHRIPKLVYVSCNPSTLARDLKELSRIYQVQYIQSVDMFPQTARVEAVVSLRLKNDED